MEGIKFVMSAPGCSGRGVWMRDLTPSERDKVAVSAAVEVGPGATNTEYGLADIRNCVIRSLLAVTKDAIGEGENLQDLQDSDWIELTPQKLCQDPSSQTYYDRLFGSKDDSVLTGVFRRRNLVSSDDIDAILGKAIAASSP